MFFSQSFNRRLHEKSLRSVSDCPAAVADALDQLVAEQRLVRFPAVAVVVTCPVVVHHRVGTIFLSPIESFSDAFNKKPNWNH